MGKKRRREQGGEGEQAHRRWDLKAWQWVALGVAVVAVSAGIAVGVVTLLGGSELSEAKPTVEVPGPIGPAPEIERSAAADVLAGKTWDEMTDEERALVRSEMERVYANTDFRVRSGLILALDIARREGRTVATRRHIPIETPGGRPAVATVTQFFCPRVDDPGIADLYEYSASPIQTPTAQRRQRPTSEAPLNPLLTSARWDTAEDLGFKEIDGRRAHGFRLQFTDQADGDQFESEYWVDTDNARVLQVGPDEEPTTYHIDYRRYPPIVPPLDEDVPCADIYGDDAQ